jgi:hypothetical protein
MVNSSDELDVLKLSKNGERIIRTLNSFCDETEI